jgi:universal stress protein E
MKITRWKKIMVAVRDIDRSAEAVLAKAINLAQRFEAELEVLHVSSSVLETFDVPGVLAAPKTPEGLVKAQQRRLDKLLEPFTVAGVKITCISAMDYPIADGIVRQVLKRKPDLLLVQSHRHPKLARIFLSNTDWELIRNCPCPLWLMKSPRLTPSLSVLAAMDPFHAHDKPAALDKSILALAGQVVGSGAGRLGVCHAYTAPQRVVSAMNEVVLLPATPAEARRYKIKVLDAMRRAARQYAIASKDQLVIEGEAAVALPAAAKRWKADLLVMGAVSRRGIKRLFIGNTAERTLDAVSCDVLVVKPPSFKSPVPRKSPLQKA